LEKNDCSGPFWEFSPEDKNQENDAERLLQLFNSVENLRFATDCVEPVANRYLKLELHNLNFTCIVARLPHPGTRKPARAWV